MKSAPLGLAKGRDLGAKVSNSLTHACSKFYFMQRREVECQIETVASGRRTIDRHRSTAPRSYRIDHVITLHCNSASPLLGPRQ